jgi:hypothetical protein
MNLTSARGKRFRKKMSKEGSIPKGVSTSRPPLLT